MSSFQPHPPRRPKRVIPQDFAYIEGQQFTVQSHTPPDLTDLAKSRPTGLDESRNLPPLERCLLHPPAPGTLGASEVTFKIAKLLQAGEKCRGQLLLVEILRSSSESLLPSVSKVVAKLYDPLYFDYDDPDFDPLPDGDERYANEAAAYQKLKKLQGTVVPTFYGSYSLELPVGRTTRTVRLNMIEYIPGDSMDCLYPEDFTQEQRQYILKQVIDGESAMFYHDVWWDDTNPRNVIVKRDSKNLYGISKVTLIDFEISRLGRDSDDLPGTYISPILRWDVRWEREIYFDTWIDWDYQVWLNIEWAHTNDRITPYMRSAFLPRRRLHNNYENKYVQKHVKT